MISKNKIDKQVIESVAVVKSIQNKYGISGADYAELHKAFRQIHTEHLLNEANLALKEYSSAKQKDIVLMKFLQWILRHLEIPFTPTVDVDKFKGRL